MTQWRSTPRRRAADKLAVAAVLGLSALLLSACAEVEGEGNVAPASAFVVTGGSDPSPNTTTPVKPNQAPTISANPPDTIRAGLTYSYAPSASDPDGDTLRYYVNGLPSWAEFNSITGEISGRPTSADLGAHTKITITVSDGRGGVATTRSFGIWVVASATGGATLGWYPPTMRNDGSALTDLSGYRVYWSLNPENFVNTVTIDSPGLTSYMISDLSPGTWYFTMTAFDSEGIHSLPSTVVSKTIYY